MNSKGDTVEQPIEFWVRASGECREELDMVSMERQNHKV
jgi:hypothetical protein